MAQFHPSSSTNFQVSVTFSLKSGEYIHVLAQIHILYAEQLYPDAGGVSLFLGVQSITRAMKGADQDYGFLLSG